MQNNVSLNLNVRGLGESATLAIKDVCRELRRQGKQVYDLGLGQSPFPVPRPLVEALRLAAPEKDYQPVKGLPSLREAVAEFHRRKDQIETHPDHVLIGPGSKELMFLLQIVYYGEILLVTPCWVSYLPQARIIGRRISMIHTDRASGWKLTAAKLSESLELTRDASRPRLLVLNYPGNPTGLTYTTDELKELAEVARKYQIIVLSDEIYGQLHFRGAHVSIARYYPEGTIVSSGLSKWCGAGGWRLGTFTFPRELEWLVEAMSWVASETYTSVCAPIQFAAIQAFHGSEELEKYLWHARRILQALGRRCVNILRRADIHVHEPDGAFYLFADFAPVAERLKARGIQNGSMLCQRLLAECGVAALPGENFGRSRGDWSMRLAYIDFDGAAAIAASQTVDLDKDLPREIIDRTCVNVLEGVGRIAAFAAGEEIAAATRPAPAAASAAPAAAAATPVGRAASV